MNFAILLILLNVVHWACDYTHLSTKEMLEAKAEGYPPYPIMNHAFRHAVGMALVLVPFVALPLLVKLVIFQFVSHFVVDTLKGRMNVWFPSLQDPSNKFHWYVFGADQFLHQVVMIIMVYIIII